MTWNPLLDIILWYTENIVYPEAANSYYIGTIDVSLEWWTRCYTFYTYNFMQENKYGQLHGHVSKCYAHECERICVWKVSHFVQPSLSFLITGVVDRKTLPLFWYLNMLLCHLDREGNNHNIIMTDRLVKVHVNFVWWNRPIIFASEVQSLLTLFNKKSIWQILLLRTLKCVLWIRVQQ